MPFVFVDDVDEGLFRETRGAWFAQIEGHAESTSEPYYVAALDYCEKMVNGSLVTQDGGGCVCAVKSDELGYASALIMIAHAKARSEVRVLDIYVQPSLNLAEVEPDLPQLAWIAATAIVGCLQLTYGTFPAKQLKIHTAIPLDKEFMSAVTTAIFSTNKLSDHYAVSSAGNWLVVSKRAPQLTLLHGA